MLIMIWIARDLEFWMPERPGMWADTVHYDGKEFRRLTPAMFQALRETIHRKAADETLEKIEWERYSDLGRTLEALGKWPEYKGLG